MLKFIRVWLLGLLIWFIISTGLALGLGFLFTIVWNGVVLAFFDWSEVTLKGSFQVFFLFNVAYSAWNKAHS